VATNFLYLSHESTSETIVTEFMWAEPLGLLTVSEVEQTIYSILLKCFVV